LRLNPSHWRQLGCALVAGSRTRSQQVSQPGANAQSTVCGSYTLNAPTQSAVRHRPPRRLCSFGRSSMWARAHVGTAWAGQRHSPHRCSGPFIHPGKSIATRAKVHVRQRHKSAALATSRRVARHTRGDSWCRWSKPGGSYPDRLMLQRCDQRGSADHPSALRSVNRSAPSICRRPLSLVGDHTP
jgi:hypothetical protein